MCSPYALRSFRDGLVKGRAATFADAEPRRPAVVRSIRSRGEPIGGLWRAGCPRPRTWSARNVSCVSILFVTALSLVSQARADDITAANGKVYHNVEVLTRNASAMLIRSNEGETALSYSELKPADRDKYSKTLAKSIELPAMTVIGEKPTFLEDSSRSKAADTAQKEINKAIEAKKEAAADRKAHPPLEPIKLFNGGINLSLGGSNALPEGGLQPGYLGLQYQQLAPSIVEKDLKIFDDAINGK
jgi:hypothetical protein